MGAPRFPIICLPCSWESQAPKAPRELSFSTDVNSSKRGSCTEEICTQNRSFVRARVFPSLQQPMALFLGQRHHGKIQETGLESNPGMVNQVKTRYLFGFMPMLKSARVWRFRESGNSQSASGAGPAGSVTPSSNGSKTRNADSAETRFAPRMRATSRRRKPEPRQIRRIESGGAGANALGAWSQITASSIPPFSPPPVGACRVI